jgi:hypothetical protein
MKIHLHYIACALLALGCGCGILPLKGGKHAIKTTDLSSTLTQPQNPKDASTQEYDRVIEDAIPVRPGDKVDGVEIKEATVIHRKTTEHVSAKVGASQKDTAREAAAKLASLRPVVWVGILLFIVGAASAVYPPLKVLVGSITTSAVVAVAGLALIVLPSLVVGNEILIMCVGVGGAGLYFFAHRHGHLKGQLTAMLEKNK